MSETKRLKITSAIIVACLATFRNLFSREGSRAKAQKPAGHPSSNLLLRGNGRRGKLRDILDTLASTPEDAHLRFQRPMDDMSDAQSIIEHHDHREHHLDDMPRHVLSGKIFYVSGEEEHHQVSRVHGPENA